MDTDSLKLKKYKCIYASENYPPRSILFALQKVRREYRYYFLHFRVKHSIIAEANSNTNRAHIDCMEIAVILHSPRRDRVKTVRTKLYSVWMPHVSPNVQSHSTHTNLPNQIIQRDTPKVTKIHKVNSRFYFHKFANQKYKHTKCKNIIQINTRISQTKHIYIYTDQSEF